MTTEVRPAEAETLFGDRLTLADQLVQHLVTSGVDRGLIGPREVERIWSRHVLNCAVVAELLPEGAGVIDIGSGAGLPGLVLAVARPDLDVILVEPLERRVHWLDEVAKDLRLDVTVRRARAEELAGQIRGRVVTARAVAPLGRLLEWGLPLVEPGGEVLAIKGRGAAAELVAAEPVLARWGLSGATVVQCGAGVLQTPTTVVRVPVGLHTETPGPATGGRTPRSRQRRTPQAQGRAPGSRRRTAESDQTRDGGRRHG